VQRQVARDHPGAGLHLVHCRGLKSNLWKAADVEDLGAEHPSLHLVAISRGEARIHHAQTRAVDNQFHSRRRPIIHRARRHGRLNHVVVRKCTEQPGLGDVQRDRRSRRIDGMLVGRRVRSCDQQRRNDCRRHQPAQAIRRRDETDAQHHAT
jgi:hypothetical protein